MNQMTRQKFLTLFNEMLSDRNGNNIASAFQAQSGGDEIDQLSNIKEQDLSARLDQRNLLFLKKVKEAQKKIEDGTYGVCEDCGDDISSKRLLARPTANLCIACQEEKERNEMGTFAKRRDLNKEKISEENAGEHIPETEKFNSINDIHFESVVDL